MLTIQQQLSPNLSEVKNFFEKVFSEYDSTDIENFADDENQTMDEWFDVEALLEYLQHGAFIEAREGEKLVGAIFIGKQNILNWPDGKKAEIFILGVDPEYRKHGMGRELMKHAEMFGKKLGAKSIIVNTHQSLLTVQQFYERLGYQKIGSLADYYDNGTAIFFKKRLT
jgi:ribosomal protein S18 acetylase RimI-like enzyme